MSRAIAVTPRNEVAGHFGKAAAFLIFDEHGLLITSLDNAGSREIGCKHKKRLQRQLSDLGVTHITLGNIGQRSLEWLLKAGFSVNRVPVRSPVAAVLSGDIVGESLASPKQGRPCKREKGGCGCGGKRKAVADKIGTRVNSPLPVAGLTKIGGLRL